MSNEHREPPNPTATQDRVVLDPAQINCLELAIDHLRTRDREIFLSACRDGLPYAAIARQHRCSVAKVEKVIAEVLFALHEVVWPEVPS